MKYLISQDVIDNSDFVARNSFLSKPKRKGYIRLYQDNGWITSYFKIVERCQNSRAWIVERKTPFDKYWRKVLTPYNN